MIKFEFTHLNPKKMQHFNYKRFKESSICPSLNKSDFQIPCPFSNILLILAVALAPLDVVIPFYAVMRCTYNTVLNV